MPFNSPVYKKPTKRHLPEGVTHGKLYTPMLPREGLGREKPATKIMFKAPSRALHPVAKFPLSTGYSELWRTIRAHNLALERKTDPFSVSLADFLRMSSDQTRRLQSEVGATFRNLLQRKWKDGAKQVIICEGEIVYETSDEEEIISEIIDERARIRDKPCYAFSAPAAIEESAWSQVDGDDYYPTLNVEIAPVETVEGVEQQTPLNIVADFDTGNQMTKLFSAEQVGTLLGPINDMHWEQTESGPWGHYRYIRKPATLRVRDETGQTHQLRCSVQLVEKWETSNVRKWNRNRRGFVGRDVMRRLLLRIELDPATRRTRVFPASLPTN